MAEIVPINANDLQDIGRFSYTAHPSRVIEFGLGLALVSLLVIGIGIARSQKK